MYDNGYIVKYRSILTNDICLSDASHKADVFLVCISFLTYSLKKCIDNLAVWKIRVNTHTHTIIARQYIIKHLIYNGLPESIIRGYPRFTTKVPINTHLLPYFLKKAGNFYCPTVLGSVLCARISSVFCFHPQQSEISFSV